MSSLRQRLACYAYVMSDLALGLGRRLGIKSLGSGKRHARYSPEKSADYAEWYVGLFEEILGGGAYHGDVCELGPGDSLAGGVLMRARGAESVTFFERFQSQHDRERERLVAEILLEREKEKRNFVRQSRFASQSIDGIFNDFRLIQGVAAEDHLRSDPAAYDLIISNSVFQHVLDPVPLLQLCYDRLKPGGRMLHVIDLRNLGLLKRWGELAWMDTPPALHRLMVQNTGRPNRVRFQTYRQWAESLDGDFSVLIRHLVGNKEALGDIPAAEVSSEIWDASRELVEVARPHFTPTLRSHSASDHAVATFLLCVTKHGA
ncbi:class I SAM-dependent methyltransferase [Cerasicoccus arenae]|uniref:Uncharacterized protein n=1 Tax=Cerasicoccus arenae TaxID=424488 RepID=A0A8J3DLB3_9BACT|nr:class I SAM-dependent methyltransferase [Cerasicoccus arenae]MBK1858091.1 methyltransferase domain-containing protein [Cerasicoccus arenae]GHC07030.1 hypothetical protein GCM10007047_25140 [Cerasicoccus arenae]